MNCQNDYNPPHPCMRVGNKTRGHSSTDTMCSGLPFLVGLDLWQAINGDQEDEDSAPKTTHGTSMNSVYMNKHHFTSPDQTRGISCMARGPVASKLEFNEKGLSPSRTNNQKNTKKVNCCRFCLKNGEVEFYYQSHILKDMNGNIVCPILRKYICPTCGATGANAHTIRHCPLNINYATMYQRNSKILRRNAAGHITTFRL